MNDWEITPTIFKHPFTCMIAGPTQSGKTHFIYNILKNNQLIIEPIIHKIVYCYSVWQDFFNQFSNIYPKVEFHQGIIDLSEINPYQNNLIILDDLMTEGQSNISILNLFTIDSHHKNTSVVFISQNLFSQGKYSRSISLNSHYLIIFNNPRDKSQISVLGRQLFPNQSAFFLEAYEDCVEKRPFGYMFIDLKQATEKRSRVQTGIIPGEQRIIYTSK
jgi:hypothetical protein